MWCNLGCAGTNKSPSGDRPYRVFDEGKYGKVKRPQGVSGERFPRIEKEG